MSAQSNKQAKDILDRQLERYLDLLDQYQACRELLSTTMSNVSSAAFTQDIRRSLTPIPMETGIESVCAGISLPGPGKHDYDVANALWVQLL